MLKKLSLAALAAAPVLTAQGAALERTTQSASFILEDGNRVELGLLYAKPKVEGKGLSFPTAASAPKLENDTGSVARAFTQGAASFKYQINDKVSVGFKYDKPFAIDVLYKEDKSSVIQNMSAEANSANFTFLGAYRFDNNVTFFGGPAYQKVDGNVSIQNHSVIPNDQLPPNSTGVFKYDLKMPSDPGFGFVAGASFAIPDIALRASITYRSAMKYEAEATENISVKFDSAALAGANSSSEVKNDLEFKLPQSVNVEFQTGIAAKTLLMANLRWVNWKNFEIEPSGYKKSTEKALVSYGKDAFQIDLGLGRQITEKFSGFAMVSYDTGNGKPISPLGPPDDAYIFHVGGKYDVASNIDVSAGLQYNVFPDQKTESDGNTVGEFKDMSVLGFGARVGVSW